jgi:hypothetical protein
LEEGRNPLPLSKEIYMTDNTIFGREEDDEVRLTFKLYLAKYITDTNRRSLYKWLDYLLDRNMTEYSGIIVIDESENCVEISREMIEWGSKEQNITLSH